MGVPGIMTINKRQKQERLDLWQDRLLQQETAYSETLEDMQAREDKYNGSHTITPVFVTDTRTTAPHVRNIIAENIESQIDSNIPQPKVTALRKEDEALADIIECMLRNELDRLPFEAMNDMMERTVPIQGAGMWLCEWDNAIRTHSTAGEIVVSTLHPKQVIPQNGVYSRISDMDYIIIKQPQTKEYIRQKYGIDVSDESEAEPDIKGSDDTAADTDMVTQYVAYYRNNSDGIGLYSWVNDTELEDLEDYQSRRLRKCVKCGAEEPIDAAPVENQTQDGTPPEGVETSGEIPDEVPTDVPAQTKPSRKSCPYCGSTEFEESEEAYETIQIPIQTPQGLIQAPAKIPFYKPDVYPVILHRNITVFGQFLGESDVDKIADQQNTINLIESEIIDKLMAAGSYMVIPNQSSIQTDYKRHKVIRPVNASDTQLIRNVSMDEDITQDMAYENQVYEEARQIIGITDSFQGRQDKTAQSGKAKEIAAAQSAGRLESKRVMKNASFAELFEVMFKFKLAYADEPRPVVSRNYKGDPEYKEFNRYDFLRQDEAGEWYWNDKFLFSCDTSSPLASNREAMWQETRMNYDSGAFGDPANPQTQLLFWTIMEQLHYPISGQIKNYIADQIQQMQEQQAAMKAQQAEAANQNSILEAQRQGKEDAIKDVQAKQQLMTAQQTQQTNGV